MRGREDVNLRPGRDTVARDDGRDLVAVAGTLDTGVAAAREAVLVRERLGVGRLGAESFGDGRGPVVSEATDLSLLHLPISPVSEPGFVL